MQRQLALEYSLVCLASSPGFALCLLQTMTSPSEHRIIRGHIIRLLEKYKEQVWITLYTCAIPILHEQWICLGMQRHIHITGNNLIPRSVPNLRWTPELKSLMYMWCGCVSAFQDISTVHVIWWWHKWTAAVLVSKLVSCAFSKSYMSTLNFSFACSHSVFNNIIEMEWSLVV